MLIYSHILQKIDSAILKFKFKPLRLRRIESSHELLPIVLYLCVKKCALLLCVCVSAYVLHYAALSPSCRLLENSAIMDQYDQASLTYERAKWRFTPA